jgi:hypothetical protein
MNTDRLIDMLSAELEAVNSGRLGKTLILAIVTGGAIAFGLMLVTVGPRSDLQSTAHILFPFIAALAVALAVLLGQPQAWRELVRGATTVSSMRCLFLIMFFAAVPLAVVLYALRQGAPTRLKLCGGIAGIVAGGIGAAAYAFNCASDTIPFIAIWYGAAIVICAVVGTQLGPRVLRW